jgi:ribosomal protein S18 acetylase RimI-like enzyme
MEQNIPVKMLRSNLENIPSFALPPGFAFRWFQSGDEKTWVQIQGAADRLNKISGDLFHSEFPEPALLPEAQFYLLAPNGAPIGTATAWFRALDGERIGRVHWVAIVPEFQGRGLGRSVLSFCCQRLRESGYDRAFLSTSSSRIPAISLYLNFGFEPLITNDQERVVWHQILARANVDAPAFRRSVSR